MEVAVGSVLGGTATVRVLAIVLADGPVVKVTIARVSTVTAVRYCLAAPERPSASTPVARSRPSGFAVKDFGARIRPSDPS